jgi:hypothetical protein
MFTTIVYSTETNSIKNSFVLTFILTFRFRHAKIRNANPENLKVCKCEFLLQHKKWIL